MSEISLRLEEFTAANSGFETSRDYISLSHCGDPIEKQIEKYFHGFDDSLETRLRCYKGYQTERDLLTRIQKVFTTRITTGIEISAFDGLVKGHPDFGFDGLPGDCKSVPADEHLPFAVEGKQIPRKVFWQMQGYMYYLKQSKGLLIYEVRDTGRIRDFWVHANPGIGETIHNNNKIIVAEINRRLKAA